MNAKNSPLWFIKKRKDAREILTVQRNNKTSLNVETSRLQNLKMRLWMRCCAQCVFGFDRFGLVCLVCSKACFVFDQTMKHPQGVATPMCQSQGHCSVSVAKVNRSPDFATLICNNQRYGLVFIAKVSESWGFATPLRQRHCLFFGTKAKRPEGFPTSMCQSRRHSRFRTLSLYI